VRGHQAAARAAASVRRLISPSESLDRAEALRELAQLAGARDPDGEAENLAFHFRLRDLRQRLLA
jgi:hypothetical protein